MSDLILTRDQLCRADVLLSLGKGRLSELIRHLNGGRYSHSSLCDGERVIECVADGVEHNTIENLFEHRVYADVFRFRSDTGDPFGAPGWEPQSVIDVGMSYYRRGTKYAYHQLVMMGLLITTRRNPLPATYRAMVRTNIDKAVKLLANMMDKGIEPLTCSEFVYRCFYEAEPANRYGLTIPGVVEPSGFYDTARAQEEAREFELQAAETVDDDEAIRLLKGAFARRYALLKPRLSDSPAIGDMGSHDFELMRANPNVVSDFVSPGDLERSPNLVHIGQLILQ